jgi:hypothetical protein
MFLMRSQHGYEPFIKYCKSQQLSILKHTAIFSFPVKYATFVQPSALCRMKNN